ncbi:MAG: hypothetical protein B7X50_07960 [Alishewanella sp. 34-51-39]|nr:MAG: hypothetical protein B7X50_07960 [Alishewanella sp. 34-51-39]
MVKPSEILRKIQYDHKNSVVLFPKNGICANYEGYHPNCSRLSRGPGYSGCPILPVPGRKGSQPSKVYDRYVNKWDERHAYNRRRLDLLAWLIEQFELRGG